jgi:hypothetical protein
MPEDLTVSKKGERKKGKEEKGMPPKSFGRITFFKKSGARLYIPARLVDDSNFPFKDGEIVKVEIGNSSLKLKAVEWWEMLDWETMPETFEKLPEDLKRKIEVAQLV